MGSSVTFTVSCEQFYQIYGKFKPDTFVLPGKEVEFFGKEKTFTHCMRKKQNKTKKQKQKPPHFPVKKNDPSISYTENIKVSQYAKPSHLSHFLSVR